jgi:hypothetical protein
MKSPTHHVLSRSIWHRLSGFYPQGSMTPIPEKKKYLNIIIYARVSEGMQNGYNFI